MKLPRFGKLGSAGFQLLEILLVVLFCGTLLAAGAAENSSFPAADVIINPGRAYDDSVRVWQGIPGIERAPHGRLWATWYSGGLGEGLTGNYVLLATSGDDGQTWSKPVVVIQGPGDSKIVDPLPWVDPQGRLWVFYHQITAASKKESRPRWDGTCAIRTDTPDEAAPMWSKPMLVYPGGCLFGKPILPASGGWVAPFFLGGNSRTMNETCTLITTNEGASWQYLGGTTIPFEMRNFSESTLAQRQDGSLWMVIRRVGGLHQSTSVDNGRTWSAAVPLREGTQTRAHMRRLASGAFLLIYHDVEQEKSNGQYPRNRLAAWLSDDEGKTWPHKLLLDERAGVSYPDATQAPDGRIYIAYDRFRYRSDAKEILLGIIHEADIRAGKIVSPDARLQLLINRAQGYGNTQDLENDAKRKKKSSKSKQP
ncbi:MAG: exo-alpha-sialidase [Verrucomicrobia bacterium]|nr:MAG: exo-alpha-sialidase [Verrucomicrobiota bacterium]